MKKKTNQNRNSDHSMAHVLYQRLGDKWYAFTEVDGNLFMGKLDDNEIDAKAQEEEDTRRTNRKNLKAA